MDWFRMYGEMTDDPKIGKLNDAEFRTWVELLCAACKQERGGKTGLKADDIDWSLRRNVTETLPKLISSGLVTQDETGEYAIFKWESRQYKSDSSADRVRAHRAKVKKDKAVGKGNVTETLQKQDANGLDTDTDTEKNKKTKTPREPRFDAQAHLESLNVPQKVAEDWLTHRKTKKAAVTETVIANHVTEATSAGITLQAALTESCSRGWVGFKAEWYANAVRARDAPATSRTTPGRHSGFSEVDYREGVTVDGVF